MSSARPGRQRMGMKIIPSGEIRCSHCSKKFKSIFEMDKHLAVDHGLNRRARAKVYVDMKIIWYQNYAPPGFWVE